ncbi:MAG: hypothetical protein FVQ83_09305 [Chloroflexi bacterium]|nr:hypothetical protein [Chloroflexota bacterium]
MLNQLFSKPKYDIVVEAVRYRPDGQVEWVRAYERRGPTWSDHVLIDRETLIEKLEAGRRVYFGKRKEFLASEFEISAQIHLLQTKNGTVLVSGDLHSEKDQLDGIPVI